ncbi:hypothetical protein A1A1_15873 [Planococcus antarcticus DSM 14505]|uniref:FAD-dependent urate hydroxylase HpyO/Asp monooxygenase CreE-like FAD/NAD(P)-binding domain-containing protein n=1 Tax=Planococcus antarcticus DSM 14505 TaxID=1185653 RepID=A0A1C7DDL5_9BACL|nr:FAD/NAD(P)-binding protein [Planococcus antarcticus]ANU09535.1 hypothetical protein BBH88_04040 [Planococcus antarcticus DSM 14505]EIM05498.1 hypothetical protein A1A1_15873 [Planococcus antarcticus DSM 14505]
MYKWIIVGGGIQGTTMANFLLKQHKVASDELAIIDPHTEPLANWNRYTNAISMPFLRSPSVHHIDVNPFSLEAFVKDNGHNEGSSFLGRLKRPSRLLFQDHCEHLVKDLSLKRSWVQGSVQTIDRAQNGWQVQLQSGQLLQGENMILAIGISEQLSWPEWAKKLKKDAVSSVYHIFDPALPDFKEMQAPFTVVGGGITAVHLTLKLNTLFPKQVRLLKRHPFRMHDFDSDPGWLGPKNQTAFRKTGSYKKRREKIVHARHKGSIPRDLYIKLRHQIRQNHLLVSDGQVHQARMEKDSVKLYDEQGRLVQQTGTVLLATGFIPTLPGQEWLTPVIKKHQLKCADCGYPIISETLQWGPNLYVMGALAELEIGPIARNISGARQAAERITNSL